MQPDGWDLSELKYVELNSKEFAAWRLDRGDILFNRTNSKELVGKCEVFAEPGDWVFASYLMRLTVDPKKALPEFVAAYLSGPSGRAQIERDSRQIIGMTNINAEEIRALQIPLPEDFRAQAAMLAKLDAARAERDAGLAAAETALTGLDAFILDALGLTLPAPHDLTRPFAPNLKMIRAGRLDPQFYIPSYVQNLRNVQAGSYRLLGEIVQLSQETRDPRLDAGDEFQYLEIGAVELRADRYELGTHINVTPALIAA